MASVYDIKQINEMTEEQRCYHIKMFNPRAFLRLRPENITHNVCRAALDAGINLYQIPYRNLTKELCAYAYFLDRNTYIFIPEEFRTNEMNWFALNTPEQKHHVKGCMLKLAEFVRELCQAPEQMKDPFTLILKYI
jgi:hypothetical protein